MISAREVYHNEGGATTAFVTTSFDAKYDSPSGLHCITFPDGITKCTIQIFLPSN